MKSDEIYLNLKKEGEPPLLVTALKNYGLKETPGKVDSPVIMAMAKHLRIDWYNNDETPWCGLVMGFWCDSIELPFSYLKLLAAKAWATYGKPVKTADAALGDILVFARNGGGHVGLYVGETPETYYVYGGNQSNTVCITEIAKARLIAVRRPDYKCDFKKVRKIHYLTSGKLSTNER